MQINGNLSVLKNNVNKQNSARINKKSSNYVFSDNRKVANNPALYQAYNGVSFKSSNEPTVFQMFDDKGNLKTIRCQLPLENGETEVLYIDRETIDKFLVNNDGTINNTAVKQYAQTYQAVLDDDNKKSDEFVDFLQGFLNGKTYRNDNITCLEGGIDPQKKAWIKESDDAYNHRHFSKLAVLITNSREYAEGLLNGELTLRKEKDRTGIRELTNSVFEICKSNVGYDTSNLNDKIEFAIATRQINSWRKMKGIEPEIIKASRINDGSVDTKRGIALIRLLMLARTYTPNVTVPNYARIIDKFCSMDEENSELILESLIKYEKTSSGIRDGKDNFEGEFIQSFNPVTGKFDEEAFKRLQDYEWAVGRMLSFTAPSVDGVGWMDLNEKQRIISKYFELVRDPETGCLTDRNYSPREIRIFELDYLDDDEQDENYEYVNMAFDYNDCYNLNENIEEDDEEDFPDCDFNDYDDFNDDDDL